MKLKKIEGGAESMPFAYYYFVQNLGRGHNYGRECKGYCNRIAG